MMGPLDAYSSDDDDLRQGVLMKESKPILTAMLASPKRVVEGAAFDVSLDCSVAADDKERRRIH